MTTFYVPRPPVDDPWQGKSGFSALRLPGTLTAPAGLGAYIVGTVAATFAFSPNLPAGIGAYLASGITATFNLNTNRWTAISPPTSTWTPEQ